MSPPTVPTHLPARRLPDILKRSPLTWGPRELTVQARNQLDGKLLAEEGDPSSPAVHLRSPEAVRVSNLQLLLRSSNNNQVNPVPAAEVKPSAAGGAAGASAAGGTAVAQHV